jgi:hypothetical protein
MPGLFFIHIRLTKKKSRFARFRNQLRQRALQTAAAHERQSDLQRQGACVYGFDSLGSAL